MPIKVIPLTQSVRRGLLCSALLVSVLGAGCATMPESVELAKIKDADNYNTETSFAGVEHAWPQQQWWQAYQDPQLNQLIDEALATAPDLHAASARLQEAAAMLGISRSALRPDVSLNASVSEQKLSYNTFIPGSFLPQGWNDYGSVGVNLSWDLDFWGRNEAAFAAATSEFTARQAELAQARLVLTSAVAQAYADLSRLHASLDTAEQSLAVRSKTAELFAERQQHGLENIGTVREAEARRAVAEGNVLALQEQLTLTRHQLAALIGKGPDRGLAISRPTINLTQYVGVPANLGLELLGRRPDIVAAKWGVEAQQQRIDSAEAAFYPNVNLSAAIGLDVLGLNNLTDKDSYMGSVGPAISLPIFNGGRLRSQLGAAQARYEQAVAAYDGAVTHALQDVADVLASQRALTQRIEVAEQAVTAASEAHRVAQNRYQGGMANYLQVLSAEDALLVSREALTNLHAQSLTLDVQLNRALGGGYQTAEPHSSEH